MSVFCIDKQAYRFTFPKSMKILITAIDFPQVKFQSEFGSGSAEWLGDLPLLNEYYQVELDFDDDFEWEKNLFPLEKEVFRIQTINGKFEISAKVIPEGSGGGCFMVKIGVSIVLINVSNCPEGYSGFVKIFPAKMGLNPVKL